MANYFTRIHARLHPIAPHPQAIYYRLVAWVACPHVSRLAAARVLALGGLTPAAPVEQSPSDGRGSIRGVVTHWQEAGDERFLANYTEHEGAQRQAAQQAAAAGFLGIGMAESSAHDAPAPPA